MNFTEVLRGANGVAVASQLAVAWAEKGSLYQLEMAENVH